MRDQRRKVQNIGWEKEGLIDESDLGYMQLVTNITLIEEDERRLRTTSLSFSIVLSS